MIQSVSSLGQLAPNISAVLSKSCVAKFRDREELSIKLSSLRGHMPLKGPGSAPNLTTPYQWLDGEALHDSALICIGDGAQDCVSRDSRGIETGLAEDLLATSIISAERLGDALKQTTTLTERPCAAMSRIHIILQVFFIFFRLPRVPELKRLGLQTSSYR